MVIAAYVEQLTRALSCPAHQENARFSGEGRWRRLVG